MALPFLDLRTGRMGDTDALRHELTKVGGLVDGDVIDLPPALRKQRG